MTPQQREAALRLINDGSANNLEWSRQVIALLRELATAPQGEPVQANTAEDNFKVASTAGLGQPMEEALKRAYYYTEAGEWRGPEVDEWDRWHAVAKVAARSPLSEGALMGVYMDFDRRADKTWPPAEYLLRFAAAVQDAVLKGPSDAELERRTGEPHIDGWPLYSGLPPAA